MQTIGTPDNLFHDGDPTTGALGTIVSAAFMNAVQGEIVAPIAAAGLALNPANNGQLLAAILILIESKMGNYALDTGQANAYVVALAPAVGAYSNGLPVKFRATHANNTPSTLDAGAGPVPLLRDDGVALQLGDVPAGGIVSATYDTSAGAFLVNSVVPSQIATQVAAILGASPKLGGTPTGPTPPQNDNSTNLSTTAWGNGIATHGQCRLSVVSATSLKLSPYNGRNLIINGTVQQIPIAGITVSNAGLAANTVYYVYALMNAGTMALEVVTTAHAPSSNGVEQKAGDASRTLVGMIYTNSSSQFVDSATSITLLNWFNRVLKYGATATISASTTYGGGLIELSASSRIPFLTWADELVHMAIIGTTQNTVAGGVNTTSTGIDGSAGGAASNTQSYAGGGVVPAISSTNIYSAEGYHVASAFVEVSTGQGNWSVGTQVVVVG